MQSDQPKARRFRVSLHFAELSDVAPGDRVFDIEIQGEVVLKDFDPVVVAGGLNRATTKVFKGVRADRALDIRFINRSEESEQSLPPILSAIEVLLDR